MTYSPRPGDIGITKISGWGGKAIRAAQWLNGDGFADYEHAYVVTSVDDDGTVWIVEAMPGGAQHVRNWHTDTRWLVCPDQYRQAVAQCAMGYVGVGYSALDYTYLAAHRFHIPAPHLKHLIKTTHHMICSQLADAAADNGGWHLFNDHRWEGDVTPGDLNHLWVINKAAGTGMAA